MLVLHDLQWADEASVILLRDLAERVATSQLLILGTFWDSDLDPSRPFTRAMSRLLRRRRAQRMTLGPLADKDVARMIAGLAKKELPELQMVAIQAATEGNPLFVEHSYLHLAESEGLLGGGARVQTSYTEEDLELAQSVRGLIGRRLERLSEPANRVLVAAAVIGRDFDVKLMEAFGELSGRELRDAIDEAMAGHFLAAAGPDRYRFAHELVRQRVIASLTLPRRQAYHLAIADTLERVFGKADATHSAEIGYHLYQAGTAADATRTGHHLLLATKRAVVIGAFEEVLRLAETTLLLLPADEARERAQVLVARGQALWGLGRLDQARGAWASAIERFEELGDHEALKDLRSRLERLEAAKLPTVEPAEVVAVVTDGEAVADSESTEESEPVSR
jgi:predicted ATPase